MGELASLHQRRGGTTLHGTGYVRDSLGRLTQLTDSVRDAGGTLQVTPCGGHPFSLNNLVVLRFR